MQLPRNIDDLLKALHEEPSVLAAEDEAYLKQLIAMVRAGKRAVLIVEQDDKLKYTFSNASKADALAILGRVIEATGRRMAE